MVKIASIPVTTLVETVSGTVVRGNAGSGVVTSIGEPLDVEAGGVTFVISETFVKDVERTKADVLVVNESLADKIAPLVPSSVKAVIACKDAYVGLAMLSAVAAERDRHQDWRLPESGADRIHPTAKVDPTAKLGPGVVVCEGASIGARTTLLANVVVGPETVVGSDCKLFPGVVLYPRTRLGDRVRLHGNVVLGGDGFGYARGPRGSVKIWHLGRVVVGDDVEVGPGSMIDRGTLKDTVIERGAKIDNLVQIGHNGHVKAHAILCAQTGLAGNVTVGVGAILAGQAGIADKVDIGDGAIIGPQSGISKDVAPKEIIMGTLPGKPRREWWRIMALIDRLPDLFDRVKKLEKS